MSNPAPDDSARTQRRPCAAERLMQQAGSGVLRVPFARCGDGVARHVSTVADVRQGPFHCLDCGEALSLRQPISRRRHFAHRPDTLCTGETALHRYAKELLEAARTLTLPALVLEGDRVRHTVFEAGVYGFDEVLPERAMGTFQPDALVRYQGFELAVEFLVHHAVDGEKRAKVRDRDVSMVEIDLSGLKAGRMEGRELDVAILHTAPRTWIHHRRAAAARRKLEAAVERERAERGARLRGHILRSRRAVAPKDWDDEATAAVRRVGLEELVGLEVDGGHWFTVPDATWQAQALSRYVVEPSELYSPGGRALVVRGGHPNDRDLSSGLPPWMIRRDLAGYPVKRLAEAGFTLERYGSPHAAVWSYLAALSMMGKAVVWSREDQCFHVEPELHGLLHRRVELRRRVLKLLAASGVDDVDAGYRRWAESHRVDGIAPLRLIETGGEPYRVLVDLLMRLDTMVSGYLPTVVDDLCGLPLEAVRRRNREAIAAREAEKAAASEKAASERQLSIRAQAGQMLEEEADAWLRRTVPGRGIGFLDYARQGDDALAWLERRLAEEGDARRKRIVAERYAAQLRAQLTDAAKRAFPSEQLAQLFLNSGHPRLGGCRPVDRCDTPHNLALIMGLMPRTR